MVALAASAMCQRIDRISVLESLDVSGYGNEQMFRALGFDLEKDDPRALGFMTIRQGHIAGFKGTVAGVIDGQPAVECRFVWKIGQDMTPDWPVTRGYVVEIEGEPNVRLTLESPDGHFDGAITTAMPCVNAIPVVCAAPPGVLNQADLPLICGTSAGV